MGFSKLSKPAGGARGWYRKGAGAGETEAATWLPLWGSSQRIALTERAALRGLSKGGDGCLPPLE